MDRTKLVIAALIGAGLTLGGGGKVLALATKAVSAGQELLFAACLPSAMRQYATLLLEVAASRGVSPWLLAGIMWIESNAGTQLQPPDETGTGDFTPRDPARWTMAAPNGMPPDGKGWGRGLMQIDYGVHLAWVNANAWWDARVNITKSADILKSFMNAFASQVVLDSRYTYGGKVAIGGTPAASKLGLKNGQVFDDPRPLTGAALNEAALNAYNAGALQVLQALAAGRTGDSVTTGGRYASFIAGKLATWASAFPG